MVGEREEGTQGLADPSETSPANHDQSLAGVEASNEAILWVDCLGGLAIGALVLALSGPLSRWEGLPLQVIIFLGAMNVTYGVYSLYVTTRSPRGLDLVKVLAVANMSWLVVCLAIAYLWRNEITTFGLAHVVGEGLYVAGLGSREWRLRDRLGVS